MRQREGGWGYKRGKGKGERGIWLDWVGLDWTGLH